MAGIEISISGLGELDTLTAPLKRAGGSVGAKGAKVVRRNAARVERFGKQYVSVDTGATKNSIGVDTTGDGRLGEIGAEIGPTTDWAPFLERGTSRMPPYAFMGPAFDRVQPDFVADCEALVADIDL